MEVAEWTSRERDLQGKLSTIEEQRAALEAEVDKLKATEKERKRAEAEARARHEAELKGREGDADYLLVELINTRMRRAEADAELDDVKQRLKALVRATHASGGGGGAGGGKAVGATAAKPSKQQAPAHKAGSASSGLLNRTASLFSSFSLDSSFVREDSKK
jgi:DNA repair exonuclease SbcCD ATPase subunit